MRTHVLDCPVIPLILIAGGSSAALAGTVNTPPHSHAASPVVTWPDPAAGPPAQHQHRTGHDPRAGTKSHVGAGNAYRAYGTWTNAVQHSSYTSVVDGSGRKLVTDAAHAAFAHGHQDSPARYAVHKSPAKANGFPAAVAAAAEMRTFEAVNSWLAVGNASGAKNWPGMGTDNDEAAGTGVAWESSMNWIAMNESAGHQVHITYENTTGTAGNIGGLAVYDPGLKTIQVRTDEPWYFGSSTDKTVSPHSYDFGSVILHEFGHTVGLLHFGDIGTHIMTGADQPFRDGHFSSTHGHAGGTAHVDGDAHAIAAPSGAELLAGMLRSIDADATHGVRDLYAISTLVVVPMPSALSLGLVGLAPVVIQRRRRADFLSGA